MAYSEQSSGDEELDKLLTAHHNAVFDCGDWRDIGEDPAQDEDRKYQQYSEAMAVAEKTRAALYEYLRRSLGK